MNLEDCSANTFASADPSAKVHLIMRQTTYSFEEAQAKLLLFADDAQKVLRDYLNFVPAQSPAVPISVNQQIYSEIRQMMDAAAKTYTLKNEIDTKK